MDGGNSEIESHNNPTANKRSDLAAGLDAARYYLSKSIRNSTKQQVYHIAHGLSQHTCVINPNFLLQYDRVYDIWRDFCRDNDLQEFGADHQQLAACLSLVMIQDQSYSKVVMLSAAIANEYRIRMLPSPTTHETISTLFRGFRNEHPQNRTAKLPITEEILGKLYSHLYQPQHGRDGQRASIVIWRTVWRIAMEYHTLGRFSDIVKLRRNDIVYQTSPSPHLKILFQGGKNDQYSEGSERVVASNPDERRCPVALTLNYFQFLGPSYSGYLIPSCTSKNAPNPAKAVPYSGALSDMKKLMTTLGYNAKLYGEHSGKRRGATTAAANGLSEKQLKRLGGWRSDAMPAKYVDLSIPDRIAMSQRLQK